MHSWLRHVPHSKDFWMELCVRASGRAYLERMAAAAGLTARASFATSDLLECPQSPAASIITCKARASSPLSWYRPAWQSSIRKFTLPVAAQSALVRARKPSEASQQRVAETLEFLKGLGFDEEKAEQVMQRGQLARSRVSTLAERAAALESLPFTREEVILLIGRAPMLLHFSPDNLRESLGKLEDLFGLTPVQVKKAISKHPASMGYVRVLGNIVERLQDLGLTRAEVGQVYFKNPRAVRYTRCNTEELEALHGLGFSKQEIAAAILRFPAMLATKAARNYRQLVQAMKEQFGADAETCKALVLAHPQHLTLRTATIVQKVAYLVKVMGRDVSELLKHPSYVCYSLEKRIRPRYEACMGVGMGHLSLGAIMGCSDAAFAERMQKWREKAEATKKDKSRAAQGS